MFEPVFQFHVCFKKYKYVGSKVIDLWENHYSIAPSKTNITLIGKYHKWHREVASESAWILTFVIQLALRVSTWCKFFISNT